MEERTIAVTGGNVWAGATGTGDGIPLLVLHGGPGFPHHYLRPLSQLGGDRKVVFYDQLGCGGSDRPEDETLWTLQRSLAEVEAVRQAFGLDSFHLFGSSWGGLLALEYALSQPQGLVSLVLSSPLVNVPHWRNDAKELFDQLPESDRHIIESHEAKGYVDCPEYTASVLTFWKRHVCRINPWPDDLEEAYAGFGAGPYRTMWGPSEFTQTGNLSDVDPSPRLHEIGVPALWTCGHHDEARPKSTALFAALMPNSEFVEFKDSSHMPHFEESKAYLELIRDFLIRVDHDRKLVSK